ncbi:MAG TPA: hypothetical protein VGI22_11245 [Xanthobacteraceae bacterium]|jgi:hypothetical protein
MRGWRQAGPIRASSRKARSSRKRSDCSGTRRRPRHVRGTNWAIACAALAALPKRHDGEEAVDEILRQFYRLVGWAMYFALAYLTEIDPRPAVGAPVVSAQHW